MYLEFIAESYTALYCQEWEQEAAAARAVHLARREAEEQQEWEQEQGAPKVNHTKLARVIRAIYSAAASLF